MNRWNITGDNNMIISCKKKIFLLFTLFVMTLSSCSKVCECKRYDYEGNVSETFTGPYDKTEGRCVQPGDRYWCTLK